MIEILHCIFVWHKAQIAMIVLRTAQEGRECPPSVIHCLSYLLSTHGGSQYTHWAKGRILTFVVDYHF